MYIHAAANGSLEARMLYGDLVGSDGRSRRRSPQLGCTPPGAGLGLGGGDFRAGYGLSAGVAYAAGATCGDSFPDIAAASSNAATTIQFTKPSRWIPWKNHVKTRRGFAFLLAHGCLEKLGKFLPGSSEVVGFVSVWPPLHAASAHDRRTEEFLAVAHLQCERVAAGSLRQFHG